MQFLEYRYFLLRVSICKAKNKNPRERESEKRYEPLTRIGTRFDLIWVGSEIGLIGLYSLSGSFISEPLISHLYASTILL